MHSSKYILALDQGTSSSRAILFDHSGSLRYAAQREIKQYYPQVGWVEEDPNEIWSSQIELAAEVIRSAGITPADIACIGITNQRETTLVWDRQSGEPVYPAIVWQDRRTSALCDKMKSEGLAGTIQEKTGLMIDPYFSATKLNWILQNVPGLSASRIAFGTVDSWLLWKLTAGAKHFTDISNASRTMLFNIHTQDWDAELLRLFNIPREILPYVRSSSEIYGEIASEMLSGIPVSGIAGDQQAALFGQACLRSGMLKNTYGTGAFLMLNTGPQPTPSRNRLLTTIAWKISDRVEYALEGSIFVAGAVVQWLRDSLGLIQSSAQIESLARSVPDNGGVYFVPAFVGLGAPHWDPYARGLLIGITQGTRSGHIARAALESIAFQSLEVLKTMEADSGIPVQELRVDGGATVNELLMQFQADISGIPLIRPKVSETTALGAAYLAGLCIGYWKDLEEIESRWQIDRKFEPQMDQQKAVQLFSRWQEAVQRAKKWSPPDSTAEPRGARS